MNEQTFTTMVATAELLKAQLSDPALQIMADDLERYSDDHLMIAFKRLRQDGSRFNTAEVIKRLPAMWPGAEQAWATFPRSEMDTACVCSEMQEAWAIADGLDEISGRMAFKEAYNRAVSEAMSEGRQPEWCMSMGHDASMREQATLDAVASGLLPSVKAKVYLPHIPIEEIEQVARKQISGSKLLENHAQTVNSIAELALPNPSEPEATAESSKAHLANLMSLLKGGETSSTNG